MKFLSFSIALLLGCLSANAQENLLVNPGFEEGVPSVVNGQKDTQGTWLAYFQGTRGGMDVEESEGVDGSCIKLNVYKAEKPVWDNYIYQNLDLTPGEYRISFFVKADKEAEDRTAVRFSVKPKTSSYMGTFKAPFSPKKKVTTEWQQVVHTLKIAPDQTGLEGARFIIHLEEPDNTYYIDNVELTKIK